MALRLKLNPEDAYEVLSRPDIFETISEDGVTDVPMPDSVAYLCGYAPELVGCFIIRPLNRICMDVHVQVFPEHRKAWAEEFGRAVIEWTWENTSAQKMVAQIPCIYPNVKDFALKMGFNVEGKNKHSWRKNGEVHDQWYLGVVK